MLGQNCYDYILIGLFIRTLRNIKGSDLKKDVNKQISHLTDRLISGNFEVTLAAMESIDYIEMLNELQSITDENQNIDDKLAKEVISRFIDIETVVFAEASTKKIYILPSRRFNSDYLLNHPEKLFTGGVYEKFDDIAQHDINSACRCLLFGEATAAAFHILRATEAVLKKYYFHHHKTNRLAKPMWSNMLDQLRAKTRNKPPETLLNSLDLIRTAYRNPTQHPEAIYEIDSAQDLFGVCLDAIGKMGSEI